MTGTTSPSEVDANMIATNSGLRMLSIGWSPNATTTARPSDATNATEIVPMRPRSRAGSISSPARNSRNPSPSSESTTTGVSISSHPSPEGPTMTPRTISNATAGIRTFGARFTRIGARNATTVTTRIELNEIDGSRSCGMATASTDRGYPARAATACDRRVKGSGFDGPAWVL